MKNEAFWKFLMAGSLLGWLFLIFGLIFPFAHPTLKVLWWAVLVLWGIGPPLEMAFSLPIGREKGRTLEETIVKTMLFGFTWWLPLKLGVTVR